VADTYEVVMKKLTLALTLAALLAACSENASNQASTSAPPKPTAPADQPATPTAPTRAAASDAFAPKLDTILAGSWRSDANKARDTYRHPKETLAFFGVKPGDTLIEITPGGGWYSEILAPLMKGDGTYIAAIQKPKKAEGEDAQDKAGIRKKFADDAAEYGDAKIVEFDGSAPNFGPANSADVVVTFRNVHNWTAANTAPQMFKAFFDVLKPGGTLGVEDHRAAEGANFEETEKKGYLPTETVIKLATDAGFRLKGKSEINANPKDTKDYEQGVWTLPPTFALKDKDHDKYAAIGESDRMTLKFIKVGNEDRIFQQGNESSGGGK
jgi:predicted methyltransferase